MAVSLLNGLVVAAQLAGVFAAVDNDPNGYIVYCPCMGRFGNQADHFLGALSFAKQFDRTLVLPPWVEYVPGQLKAKMVDFDEYFSVAALLQYHRVIPMRQFMREIAPRLWPTDKRKVACHGPRRKLDGTDGGGCNAKEGNPFGPFWDHSNIDFVGSEFYAELGGYDLSSEGRRERWRKRFPVAEHPVLAFTGAPAAFPVEQRNVGLHRYLKWSDKINAKADEFVRKTLPKGPFVGIHLRNDRDWDNVCKHVAEDAVSGRHLFASAQCLGYEHEHGHLTMEICMPSDETIFKQVKAAVKATGAKSVFVAADRDHMIDRLNKALKRLGVTAYRQEHDEPHVSLALLGRAAHYIGNCVSTFSAFAKRERDAAALPTSFWGFKSKHDEL